MRLTRTLAKGTSTLRFKRRLGPWRLKPGTYRLTATAKDGAGNVSKRVAVRLRGTCRAWANC